MNWFCGRFSFKGEIGRGRMWLTYFSIGILWALAELPLIFVARETGWIPADFNLDNPSLPSDFKTASFVLAYYFVTAVVLWIFVAALVKRLRDVGIALKWLAIFVPVFALYGLACAHFIPEGATQPSALGIAAVIVTGLPACVLAFWIFGSAFLTPSSAPRQFDPEKLPEGWKK